MAGLYLRIVSSTDNWTSLEDSRQLCGFEEVPWEFASRLWVLRSDGVWVNEPRRGRLPDSTTSVASFTLSDLLALAKGPLGVTNLLLSTVPSGWRGSFSYRARIRYSKVMFTVKDKDPLRAMVRILIKALK